ncbi:MAG: autotransporter outer membrane beta-barrel domain-containing protein, partial [Parachlamydiales bacterium]
PTQKFNLWADSFYDHIRQNNKTHKMGFSSNSAYGVLGGDYRFSNEAILGSFAAYSYSRINWLNMKGKGNINSIYLGAYSGLVKNAGFINGSVLGSLNLNNANRNIYFSSITRKAEGDFDGLQVSARLNGAITKNLKKMQCQPFFEFDYEYIYNEKIKEKKAQDLNLMIDSKNYNMLRGELGCNFSTCFHTRDNSSQWFPEAKVSWIGEKRMGGKRYRSHLVDQKDYFIVTADNPNSVRVGLGAGLTATFEKEKFTANLRYDIEFARKFDDQKAQIAIYYNFK